MVHALRSDANQFALGMICSLGTEDAYSMQSGEGIHSFVGKHSLYELCG